ncbi:MAG: PQQ-dependent sugar dehydrogenase [Solirubrobacterales bacterium]|nr:PQQ-dependent sugar dehydrogenase [Solirubrobacterales bacterium]
MGGSRIRRLHSIPLAALVFTAVMGFTTTACAGSDSSTPVGTTGTGAPRSDKATTGATTSRKHGLRLSRVARFSGPVEIKSAPGYRNLMFVVEQKGKVRVLRRGKKLSRPFLNIANRVNFSGERGLLSIAFPPDYRKSKRFYVYYTDNTGDIKVDEYHRNTSVTARRRTRRSVITIPHRENSNHNGGQMQFLGNDLYFGTGDGGGGGDQPGNAQNLNVLLGKMIRIDPRRSNGKPYSIPAKNPFVGRSGRDEIFAYGLRNPFRWSFDKVTGRGVHMVIADVGEGKFEEMNYLPLSKALGTNFGWNRFEGFSEYNGGGTGTTKPDFVTTHDDGNCSIIGGILVRDKSLKSLRGRFLFTDFCKGQVRTFKPSARRITKSRRTGLTVPQISSFGESRGGAVYATSTSGSVYRLRQ